MMARLECSDVAQPGGSSGPRATSGGMPHRQRLLLLLLLAASPAAAAWGVVHRAVPRRCLESREGCGSTALGGGRGGGGSLRFRRREGPDGTLVFAPAAHARCRIALAAAAADDGEEEDSDLVSAWLDNHDAGVLDEEDAAAVELSPADAYERCASLSPRRLPLAPPLRPLCASAAPPLPPPGLQDME